MFAPGSDGSQICLVTVSGFLNGIELRSDNNAVRLSRIGTTPGEASSTSDSGNGILVNGDNNLIGGRRNFDHNVISGNSVSGVVVTEASGTRIEGNLIGTDSSGSTAVSNGIGIEVLDLPLITLPVPGSVPPMLVPESRTKSTALAWASAESSGT